MQLGQCRPIRVRGGATQIEFDMALGICNSRNIKLGSAIRVFATGLRQGPRSVWLRRVTVWKSWAASTERYQIFGELHRFLGVRQLTANLHFLDTLGRGTLWD